MIQAAKNQILVKQLRTFFYTSLLHSLICCVLGVFAFLFMPLQAVGMIALGVAVGVAFGYYNEQKELQFIEERGEIKSIKITFYGILKIAGLFLIVIGVLWLMLLLIYNNTQGLFLSPFLSPYFWLLCAFLAPVTPVHYETRIRIIK